MVSAAGIAAELRDSILKGELTAGDRLPSAREITRTWKVAIATASRVHALLRAEGLAHSEPGIGTTVTISLPTKSGAAPENPGIHSRPPLGPTTPTRPFALNRIVAAGIEIADAEGLEAVTIRRVAHALRTVPKSLYLQVSTRQEFELRLIDEALGEWHPGRWSPTWRERLLVGHRELWKIFRAHPWLAQVVSVTRPQLVPAALSFAEWALETLGQAGMAPEDAFEAHVALFTHIRGIAILLEPEIEAESESGVDADTWIDDRKDDLVAQISGGRHPALSALADSGYELDVDRLFERSISALIEGLADRIVPNSEGSASPREFHPSEPPT